MERRLMKVGIVGAGHVGSTTAYALTLRGSASEIVLTDLDPVRAAAEAEDVAHAVPVSSPVRVSSGPMEALSDCDVVVLTCGPSMQPGQSRLDILQHSAAVFRAVVPEVIAVAPDALLIVASNPVDVMAHVTADISGVPPSRIIGSGTILDTLRFRAELSAHLGVSASSVHAYVLGEHGDSEVLAWSTVRIGGLPLGLVAAQLDRPITRELRAGIDAKVRRAGYRIIEGKGFTAFGVAAGIARIVDAVRDDERAVLSVSSRTPIVAGVADVCVSLQRIVGRAGIVHTLDPDMNAEELELLAASARIIRDATTEVGC
jgi:L-lactate dehydrogenase